MIIVILILVAVALLLLVWLINQYRHQDYYEARDVEFRVRMAGHQIDRLTRSGIEAMSRETFVVEPFEGLQDIRDGRRS